MEEKILLFKNYSILIQAELNLNPVILKVILVN